MHQVTKTLGQSAQIGRIDVSRLLGGGIKFDRQRDLAGFGSLRALRNEMIIGSVLGMSRHYQCIQAGPKHAVGFPRLRGTETAMYWHRHLKN
jgi:hypothetical protein